MDTVAKTVFDDTNKSMPTTAPVGGGKEKESVAISGELPLTAVGQEVELPKEVSSVGVHMQPTSVPIPQPVSQMGVTPLGQNVSAQPSVGTISLPLTDDQIAQGIRQNATSSWRWLAEWCKRRLMQFRLFKR